MTTDDFYEIIKFLIISVAILLVTGLLYRFLVPIWIAYWIQETTFKRHDNRTTIGGFIAVVGIVAMLWIFPVPNTYYAESNDSHSTYEP